ncbi:MAG TPA: hypothetical protein VHQ47_18160 [Phycisphaerae bacterium]|jgi:hypothetical protein|nr:hypothetical protein [Phycisphaerae bacterium]
MVKSIEGIYRNGKVELLEPAPVGKDARVIVTFLPAAGPVDLARTGLSPEQAADLRGRLKPFVEDWDRPEMDAYDGL